MAQITKDQIADTLESIAQMLEIKGENIFKIRAYTNAARALETYPGDLVAAAGEGRLGEIPGVGKAIAEKITELVATGQLAYFESLKAELPPELAHFAFQRSFNLWIQSGMICGSRSITCLPTRTSST